jgi:hypothetical protein
MQVILKKTKITKSIFNQTMTVNANDLPLYEVIGFCVINSIKWILLYNSNTNELRKYVLFVDLKKEFNNSDNIFTVKVILGSNYTPMSYSSNSEIESLEFIKKLTNIKNKSISLGQIFI